MDCGRPHKNRPLQFKRGTFKSWLRANPILLEGQPAFETDTGRMKIGNGRTPYVHLPYIGPSKDGKSAYQIWKEAGNVGTIDEFLTSLIGPAGKSSYEIWLSLGHEGTIADFIASLEGDDGKSAYEIWIDAGNEGTINDFLDSLVGKSAYEIWLSLGNKGTEEDFINSLRGESAFECWKRNYGEPTSTEEDFINFFMTYAWEEIPQRVIEDLDDVDDDF